MSKTINEIFIKIADKFPIKEKYDFDDELVVAMTGSIVQKIVKDNQDGTCDLILHFKAEKFDVEKQES